MWRSALSLAVGLLTASCASFDSKTPTIDEVFKPGDVIPGGLTLWLTETTPLVGSVFRITSNPDTGTVNAELVSNAIADKITPSTGSTLTLTASISRSGSATAGLEFFKAFSPSISAADTKTLALETSDNKTWTIPGESTLKPILASLDTPQAADQYLRSELNSQRVVGQGSLYIVTAIYIADNVTLARNATVTKGASLKCSIGKVDCAKIQFGKSIVSQQGMKAKGRPIFVRLKWIGRRPRTGNLGWAESNSRPTVVTGS